VLVNYSKETTGLSQNLNQHGISIVSDEPFHENILLNLLFTLPNYHSINSIGRVIWCTKMKENKYISGIEFISLSDQDKKKIQDFSAPLTPES